MCTCVRANAVVCSARHLSQPCILTTASSSLVVLVLTLYIICRVEELERAHAALANEKLRLQEDLEEVQERLTAGKVTDTHSSTQVLIFARHELRHSLSHPKGLLSRCLTQCT